MIKAVAHPQPGAVDQVAVARFLCGEEPIDDGAVKLVKGVLLLVHGCLLRLADRKAARGIGKTGQLQVVVL